MKTWRSRAAAALAIGAAALALPLTAAGNASAADTGGPSAQVQYQWIVAGGSTSEQTCREWGEWDARHHKGALGYACDKDGNYYIEKLLVPA